MIELNEFVEIDLRSKEMDKLTEGDIYDKADAFELVENEEDYSATLNLYDESEELIASVHFSSYEMAEAIASEYFELEGIESDEDED